MKTVRLLAALLPAILAGCATLSEDECRSANWYELGQRDGRQGYATSRLGGHVEACGKLGIRPDDNQWLRGRELGIRSYCQPRNGWERGRQGSTENTEVCPPDLAAPYADGFRLGRRVHEAQRPVDRLDRERRELEEKLRKATTDAERSNLRSDLSRNDRALSTARRTLRDVEEVTLRTLRDVEMAAPR